MHQPKGMTADITPAKILMALLRPRNDCTTSGTVTKLLRRSHFAISAMNSSVEELNTP